MTRLPHQQQPHNLHNSPTYNIHNDTVNPHATPPPTFFQGFFSKDQYTQFMRVMMQDLTRVINHQIRKTKETAKKWKESNR